MVLTLFLKWVLALFGLATLPSQAQTIEEFALSDKLNEISGLESLNDSTLIAFNDGGNKSEVYLLNLEGEIVKTVDVLETKNRDWEDITRDDTYVYIGDIGNNQNKRKNLSIVRLKISEILQKDEVEAEYITFRYEDQKIFPPENDSLFYDAEGMTFYNDSIWIFTKDRSIPFIGNSYVYKVPVVPGDYTVSKSLSIPIGESGWWKDGITAVDVYENLFYILTYNRYIIKEWKHGEMVKVSEFVFDKITQRESIVVLNEDAIFVADEHNPIVGGVKMYKIGLKSD